MYRAFPSPPELPEEGNMSGIREPWMKIDHSTEFYGTVMELVKKRRGIFVEQDYPTPNRVQLVLKFRFLK